MRYVVILLVCVQVVLASTGTVVHGSGSTGTIEQRGITWTFDKNLQLTEGDATHYQYGQFVDGSYYIVGQCVVNSVDPAPEQYEQIYNTVSYGLRRINGSMVNPSTNFKKAPDASDHAFDERVAGWNATLGASFPLTLSANESSVSVDSWKETDTGCPVWNTTLRAPRPCTKASAVLTCLASAPASLAFRPSYCGSTKTIHLVSSVDLSFLPDLTPVAGYATWSGVSGYMDDPYLPDFQCGWTGVYLHPSDHMDYYYFPTTIQSTILYMLLDDSTMEKTGFPSGWKSTLAYRVIQYGIDSYGIITNGAGWGWTGGGFGQGRKLPILIAGLALNNSGMKGIGTTYGVNANPSLNHREFLEDSQTFYIAQADVNRFSDLNRTNCTVSAGDLNTITQGNSLPWNVSDEGASLPSKPTGGDYDWWAVIDYGTSKVMSRITSVTGASKQELNIWDNVTAGTNLSVKVHLFPQERLGFPEWGERHVNSSGYDYYSREYRWITGKSLIGIQLAVLAIDAVSAEDVKGLWNWNAFFDYHDMVGTDLATEGSNYKLSWTYKMWQGFRDDYGAIWPATAAPDMHPILTGIGSKTVNEEAALSFTISATDPGEEVLTYTMASSPSATGATLDSSTGQFAWTPSATQSGLYEITFTVTNVSLLTDLEVVNVTVVDSQSNRSPVPNYVANRKLILNSAITQFGMNASDADKDVLVFGFSGLPPGLSGNTSTGYVTGTPTAPGIYTTTLTVNDGTVTISQVTTIEVSTGIYYFPGFLRSL